MLCQIDGRWLIMQITTIGEVSGVLNYQIFPLGIGDDAITVSVPFEGVGDFGLNAAEGCLDASACDFDESAVVDDGSCEYTTCAGCMDSQACNFDDQATINLNDSCVYCDCGTSGSGYLLVVSEEPAAVVPVVKQALSLLGKDGERRRPHIARFLEIQRCLWTSVYQVGLSIPLTTLGGMPQV